MRIHSNSVNCVPLWGKTLQSIFTFSFLGEQHRGITAGGGKKKSDRCISSLLTFVPLRSVSIHGLWQMHLCFTWNCNFTKQFGMAEIRPKNSEIIFPTVWMDVLNLAARAGYLLRFRFWSRVGGGGRVARWEKPFSWGLIISNYRGVLKDLPLELVGCWFQQCDDVEA